MYWDIRGPDQPVEESLDSVHNSCSKYRRMKKELAVGEGITRRER